MRCGTIRRTLCANKRPNCSRHVAQKAQCARPRCAKAPSRRTGHGRRPCLAKGARAPGDEATVACQKGGMYPTFDSAAGSGEIPVFFGILPDLILRVTWFDSAAGPIPVNIEHCWCACAPAPLRVPAKTRTPGYQPEARAASALASWSIRSPRCAPRGGRPATGRAPRC